MRKIKRVALYDPYLDTLGGGEKHILSILKVFDELGYEIKLLWDDGSIINSIDRKLGLKFRSIAVIPNFLVRDGFLQKLLKTREFDYFFYVTDGSYFLSLAKGNYIFSMVPNRNLYSKGLLNRIKRLPWRFISNSNFTRQWLTNWDIDSKVLYPFIDDSFLNNKFKKAKKEKIILSVGRFFGHLHSKQQTKIIDSFKKIKRENKLFKDFRLYLVGGLKEEDEEYFKRVSSIVSNRDDIEIKSNISRKELLNIYGRSLVYWHFTGLGIDEDKHPELVEHLGITPLEAMALGCITFGFRAGGTAELIQDGINGYLFNSEDELNEKLLDVLKNKGLRNKISKEGRKFVKENFAYRVFKDNVTSYFDL